MTFSRTALLAAVAGSALAAPSMVWAVGGTTAAAVTAAQDAEFWYAGRVQRRVDALNSHFGSGSYIRRGVGLTAGHVVNGNQAATQENQIRINAINSPEMIFFVSGLSARCTETTSHCGINSAIDPALFTPNKSAFSFVSDLDQAMTFIPNALARTMNSFPI